MLFVLSPSEIALQGPIVDSVLLLLLSFIDIDAFFYY